MRILLAIDGSPCSNAAVDEVCRRPWPPGSEVRLVTVRSPLELNPLHGASPHPVAYDDIFEQPNWESAKFLDQATTELEQRAPGLGVTPVLLEGRPQDVIPDEAERWGADLIVVGSHGPGVIRRFFLGSVSLAVALHAPCSVEIVRRSPHVKSLTS